MTSLLRLYPHLHIRLHLPRRRYSPTLDWQLLDDHDDTAWRAATTQPRDSPTAPVRPGRARRWLVLAPCLVAFLVLAVWLNRWAGQVDALLYRELGLAVEADAWRGGDSTSLASPSAIRILDLHDNQALVTVATSSTVPGAPTATNLQTQVYAWSERGWTRTSPSPITWGEARRLESAHFIFEYFDRDHDAVVAAAAQLDRIYPDLVAAYPAARPRQKLTIVVSPNVAPRTSFQRYNLTGRLVTASPGVYLAPEQGDHATLITQAVVLNLINDRALQVIHDALMARHQTILFEAEPPDWNALAFSTQMWQILDLDPALPLAAWRVPLIHWSLEDGLVASRGELPAFFAAFCRDASVWRMAPLTVEIPVVCGPPITTDAFGQRWATTQWAHNGVSPLHLAYLQPFRVAAQNNVDELQAPITDAVVGPGYAPHPVTIIALATLVDYAAHTYGIATVADLLAQAPQHPDWDTLAPAVFGVSATDLESAWHAFLAQEYDVHVAPDLAAH